MDIIVETDNCAHVSLYTVSMIVIRAIEKEDFMSLKSINSLFRTAIDQVFLSQKNKIKNKNMNCQKIKPTYLVLLQDRILKLAFLILLQGGIS